MVAAGPGPKTHQLRVSLLDVSPPVWRRLRVPSELPLSVLHAILQAAFDWSGSHLWEWRIGERVYVPSDEPSWGEELADESLAVLGEVAPAGSAFVYAYDFADGWEHLVEVEHVADFDGRLPPVAVLDGSGATPPEGCGGPAGYEHLLDALADPADTEHAGALELLGEGYDSRAVDLAQLNRRLEMFWRT